MDIWEWGGRRRGDVMTFGGRGVEGVISPLFVGGGCGCSMVGVVPPRWPRRRGGERRVVHGGGVGGGGGGGGSGQCDGFGGVSGCGGCKEEGSGDGGGVGDESESGMTEVC